MATGAPARWNRAARNLRLGLIGLFLVLVGGTIGYVAFGYGVLDAIFQTVITVSTVGFGEVHKFSAGQQVFTIVLILTGVGTVAYTFSMLVETLVEGYLADEFGRRRMRRQINGMRDHVVVCGWGRVGRAIARSLQAGDTEVVVVDSSAERIATVAGPSVCGDATDEEVLRAAGIDRARVLITALNGDAENLYVALTGRSMRRDLFIVSRTASDAAVPKLLQAGADRVVNPQDLGGARMAALAVQPHVAEFLDVVMHDGSLEFRLQEIDVPAASAAGGPDAAQRPGARPHRRAGPRRPSPGPGFPHQPAAGGADLRRGRPGGHRQHRAGRLAAGAGPGRRELTTPPADELIAPNAGRGDAGAMPPDCTSLEFSQRSTGPFPAGFAAARRPSCGPVVLARITLGS